MASSKEQRNEVGDECALGSGYLAAGASAALLERQDWAESEEEKTAAGQRCVTDCYWQLQQPSETAATGALDSDRSAKGAGADDAQDLPAVEPAWGSWKTRGQDAVVHYERIKS